MKSEMCRKARPLFWLGLFITVVVACGIYVGAIFLANENVREVSRLDSIRDSMRQREDVMRSFAVAMVSWKVQHGSLPGAVEGTDLIEKLRRFGREKRPGDSATDGESAEPGDSISWSSEDFIMSPMKLQYQPRDGGRFELTAIGPDFLANQTLLFESDGTPVTESKGASNG